MPPLRSGWAKRTCERLSIASAPVALVAAKSGSAVSTPPERGAPCALSRPVMRSCSARRTRSHVSMSIAILRATRYEPPVIHAGSSP